MSLMHLGGMRLQRHCRRVRSDRLPRESSVQRSGSPSGCRFDRAFFCFLVLLVLQLLHNALTVTYSLVLPGSCSPDRSKLDRSIVEGELRAGELVPVLKVQAFRGLVALQTPNSSSMQC